MKSVKQAYLRLIGCILLCGAVNGWAHQLNSTRIAAVNLDRILRDSALSLHAQKKLEHEFAARSEELKKLEHQLKSLSDKLPALPESKAAKMQVAFAQLEADFQRKKHEFQEDMLRRSNEELAALIDRANQIIWKIAQNEGYDLVIQETVYVNPRIDLTDQVLKELAQPFLKGSEP